MTVLTSRNGELMIGPDAPVVLINDKVRVMGKRSKVPQELAQGRFDTLLKWARMGREAGTTMADVLINHPAVDEVHWLPRIAVAVHEELGCPLSLDSRDPEALAAALDALKPHKALINSITAERTSLDVLLPIAADYGAALVGMPIGDQHGMPRDVAGRVAEAEVIIEAAAEYGISKDDIVMDAICLASSVEPGSMLVTLETLQRFHEELGVATILGIGNSGHGMPNRTQIDLAYLLAAIPWGLDAAIVNPRTPMLLEEVRAMEFLSGRDPYGLAYIKHYRAQKSGKDNDF